MRCPFCKGRGKIRKSRVFCARDLAKARREIVKKMIAKGYGIRETQRLIGYKSPRAVSYILESEAGQ